MSDPIESRRILVPVDGSEPSFRALDLAVSLARDLHANLDIVSVIDLRHVDAFDGYMMTEAQFEELKVGVQEDVLARAKARLPDDAPAWRTRLLWGGVVETLLQEADAPDVAMIVLGRTGKGFFGRLLEGSVSRNLSIHSPVPITIVP